MIKRKRRLREQAELQITAFMNLMVILVPFLLITAAFSRVTVMELTIPRLSNTPPPQVQSDEKPITLNIHVTKEKVIVETDAGSKVFDKTGDTFEFGKITKLLLNIRDNVPETKKDANLLVAPDVPYDLVVQVMDVVRSAPLKGRDGKLVKQDLFPEISLGDTSP